MFCDKNLGSRIIFFPNTKTNQINLLYEKYIMYIFIIFLPTSYQHIDLLPWLYTN